MNATIFICLPAGSWDFNGTALPNPVIIRFFSPPTRFDCILLREAALCGVTHR